VASDLESEPSDLPDLDEGAPFRSTTREVRASGPGPEAESLRGAYLDLLKLALCDLAGAGTTSVIWNSVDPVHSRELEGEDFKRRVVGQDWPLHGLSMIGLERLDDLQGVVETIVADGVKGDLIEAGSWRGGATILMRAVLDSLGETDRVVQVCDSFAGFPPAEDASDLEDPKLHPLSDIDFLSARLEDVRAGFRRFGVEEGVEFVEGFFEDTLPALPRRDYALVRLDGDTYDAIRAGLDALYPRLVKGGYLIVDDYSFIDACRRAVDDYRAEHGIEEPIERIDWNAIRWRRESEPTESEQPAPAERSPKSAAEPTAAPRPTQPIPSWRELELERDLEAVRERAAALEQELDGLRGSPLAGPAAWARSRLRA
jgi:O-methyltransferase